MSSAARMFANRANALHSTGPKTEHGKSASKQNALAHGLTSRQVVLPHENREEYEALQTAFQNDYKPGTDTERELVARMADAWWRLQRACRVETALLAKVTEGAESPDDALADVFLDPKESAKLRLFQRYLAAAERAWNKSLADFNSARKERLRHAKEEADAAPIMAWMRSCDEGSAPDGFVSQQSASAQKEPASGAEKPAPAAEKKDAEKAAAA